MNETFVSAIKPFWYLPFIRIQNSITASPEGLKQVMESYVWRWRIRHVVFYDLRWDEIQDVKLETTGTRPGVRVYPKNSVRLRGQRISKYGPIVVRLRTASDGSGLIKFASRQRAESLYEVCRRFINLRSAVRP